MLAADRVVAAIKAGMKDPVTFVKSSDPPSERKRAREFDSLLADPPKRKKEAVSFIAVTSPTAVATVVTPRSVRPDFERLPLGTASSSEVS